MSRRSSATRGIAGEVAGRRAVLAGLGVVGAGTLAACSSSGSSASSTPSASTAPQPASVSALPSSTAAAPVSTAAAPVTSAAPTSAAATSAPAASSAAAVPAGFAVAESEIPVGGGKYFSADAVIITQPTAGNFKAFTSVCTHQGCPVTQITGGLMICPCHGSEYSIKDGSVVKGPAPAPLAAKPFSIAGGKVIVAKS